MVDETDVSRELAWYNAEHAKVVIANLQRNGINGFYAPTRPDAVSAVLQLIPDGAVVFRADSISLEQIGLIEELKRSSRFKFVDTHEKRPDGINVLENKERRKLQKESFKADVFISGTNAVTMDGKLVNIDGVGTRVAPMIWGPEKVILVIGVNKIVKNLEEAIARAHEVAATLNARRHFLKHHVDEYGELPCVKVGRCVYCAHQYKCCNVTTIIEGVSFRLRGRMNVVLVGEDLGL